MKSPNHYLKFITCTLLILAGTSLWKLQAQDDEYKDAPYFKGMPNYVIDYVEDIEYDNYHFFNGTKCQVVEGKKFVRQYVIKEGKMQASELQIVRNYANAVRNMGGTVFVAGVFQSEDADCADNSGYQMMAGKFVRDANEVWIEVSPRNGGENYRLTEVIKGVMKQDIKEVGLSEAVKRDSRLALAVDQTIEGNKTPAVLTTVQTPQNPTDFATKAELDALKAELNALKIEVGAMKAQLQILDVAPEEPVTDMDGNTYNTVRIGTQIWMRENLKTLKFRNGIDISPVPSSKGDYWRTLTTPASCWYNDSVGIKNTSYGALYNWFAVNNGYLCPTGWHVPTDEEWTTLTTYLGGEGLAGGKLKETGSLHWNSPNTGATNQSNFTALPGGSRGPSFSDKGVYGIWWSASDFDVIIYSDDTRLTAGVQKGPEAWTRMLSYKDGAAWREPVPKQTGLSVRCIKDN